jgi:hypothetical protein
MTIQPEGVDLRYRVLDEHKHTLFLLKFGTWPNKPVGLMIYIFTEHVRNFV